MAATDFFQFDTIEDIQIPCLLNQRIGDGRYLLLHRLGSGGYSVVYMAIDLFSPQKEKVAIKCLLYDTDTRKAKIRRELSLHGQAAALPGVVDIYTTVEEKGLFFIVLEFCPDGDLFSMVTENRLYIGRDEFIKSVFIQLMDTVHGFHKMGIFHRDLKPENILCCNKGGRLRIADFGLATSTEKSTSFGCGSYFYMSPECLAGFYSSGISAYSSRAADVWALGVILVNMVTTRSPWKSAVLTDPSFARYKRNRYWLRQMLPLSQAAFEFVDRIFANHGNNLSMTQLREQFLRIDTFYMSGSELKRADKTARLVADGLMFEAPVHDIKEEIAKDVSDRELFEDVSSPKVVVVPETPKTLSPTTPDSMAIDSPIESSLEGESKTTNAPAEHINTEGEAAPPLSPTTSCSSADSELVITPESRPVDVVEVVPPLPEDALGGKLELELPPVKRSGPVKVAMAAGGKFLAKVRFQL